MTDEARQALISGQADWSFPVDGLGAVRGLAEQGAAGVEVKFLLGGAAAGPVSVAAPSVSVAPAPSTRRKPTGPTAEIDELFGIMADMKASDIHLSVGSPPMIRHDGEMKVLPGRPGADSRRTPSG